MMNKDINEEIAYLNDTVTKISDVISDTELKLEAVPRLYKHNQSLLDNYLKRYRHQLKMLNTTINRPYFARINFKSNDVVEECYISKVGVFDFDNNIVTVDWRTPIASVYYDSNIGECSYNSPSGIINGELLLKRQYEIENKKLIGFNDVDTVSNDEMLKPYLNSNADHRLKNIVATIQSEQNSIIREKIFKNIIVQGVAGSGKTTVALHRIAYLVYNNMDRINPNQYLVIGPNKFFVNYISGVLPDLDVDNVLESTYEEILISHLGEGLTIISDEDKLIKSINDMDSLRFDRFKTTMGFKNIIDEFLVNYEDSVLPDEDFFIKGYKILDKYFIRKIFNNDIDSNSGEYHVLSKKLERAYLLIKRHIEENKTKILNSIHFQHQSKINGLNRDDAILELKKYKSVVDEVSRNCSSSIKSYFKNTTPKISKLYLSLLEGISNDYDCLETIGNITSKKAEFTDFAPLLYLSYRIYGSLDYSNIRHTVIDEAQDFGEFNYYVLKMLLGNSTFSIFGDLTQSIYQYRSINNWDEVIDSCFDSCEIMYLKKSYRTTTEIMNEANRIVRHIGLIESEPVIRHGVDVNYLKFSNNNLEMIKDKLINYIESKYKSIAIICKTYDEALKVYEYLSEFDISLINSNNDFYNGGICVITSTLAKGLEFDGVIISDASSKMYNEDKTIDMKLLFVAMTRALHELSIFYDEEITKPLR